MGQIGSKKLHRIPISMLWENSLVFKRRNSCRFTASFFSLRFLSRVYNYLLTPDKRLWYIPSSQYYIKRMGVRGEVLKSKTLKGFAVNANKGTNRVIAGNNRVFRLGLHFFFLNNFLGFSFHRTRQLMRNAQDAKKMRKFPKYRKFSPTKLIKKRYHKTKLKVFLLKGHHISKFSTKDASVMSVLNSLSL